ncbi:hypothetical protein BDW69DRAFT_163590 [Aspergillus filifer]
MWRLVNFRGLQGIQVKDSRQGGTGAKPDESKKAGEQKHTTAGIRMWSPTILLTSRRVA